MSEKQVEKKNTKSICFSSQIFCYTTKEEKLSYSLIQWHFFTRILEEKVVFSLYHAENSMLFVQKFSKWCQVLLNNAFHNATTTYLVYNSYLKLNLNVNFYTLPGDICAEFFKFRIKIHIYFLVWEVLVASNNIE